jgi:hypothetical protein
MRPRVRKLWDEVRELWNKRVKLKRLYTDARYAPREIRYLACNLKRRMREAVSKLNPWHENSYKELEEFDKEIEDCVKIINLVVKKYEHDREVTNRAACGIISWGLFDVSAHIHSDYTNSRNNKNLEIMARETH